MPKLLFFIQGLFYPDVSGGSELSHLYLFNSLYKRGWQVEVICARQQHLSKARKVVSCLRSLYSLRMPFPVAVDYTFGYPCWRVLEPSRFINEHTWLEFFAKRLSIYQPDIVFSHDWVGCPLLRDATEKGYQTVFFARHLGDFENGRKPTIPNGLKFLANSPYTASVIAKATGSLPEVILPFLELENYRASNRQRKYITFINLVHEKGANIAIEVARQLPQEEFLFVKGKWIYSDLVQNQFLEEAARLPNVTIWEHQNDMRNVYGVTDILLVPSQYPETFGRVIVEAQVNQIPVVAANIAGIPYTLGEGGILADPFDNPQTYINSIGLLRRNEELYLQISKLAVLNSQRSEFDAGYQVEKFVRFTENQLDVKSRKNRVFCK